MNRIKQCFLYNVSCRFSLHFWKISKWTSFKDKKCKQIYEEGFRRECKVCDKSQYLGKPKKYDPTAYVWLNSNSN